MVLDVFPVLAAATPGDLQCQTFPAKHAGPSLATAPRNRQTAAKDILYVVIITIHNVIQFVSHTYPGILQLYVQYYAIYCHLTFINLQ